MLIDLLKELLMELLRALFLEGFCQRVKAKILERSYLRRLRRRQALDRWLRVRHRDRLLHRLTTGEQQKL